MKQFDDLLLRCVIVVAILVLVVTLAHAGPKTEAATSALADFDYKTPMWESQIKAKCGQDLHENHPMFRCPNEYRNLMRNRARLIEELNKAVGEEMVPK